MIENAVVCVLVAGLLLWFSTKTSQKQFQKIFVTLGFLLIAISFLQLAITDPTTETMTITKNTPQLINTTILGNDTIYNYNYITQTQNITTNAQWYQTITNGNLGLFTTFAFFLFILIVWFILDILGITLDTIHTTLKKILRK